MTVRQVGRRHSTSSSFVRTRMCVIDRRLATSSSSVTTGRRFGPSETETDYGAARCRPDVRIASTCSPAPPTVYDVCTG